MQSIWRILGTLGGLWLLGVIVSGFFQPVCGCAGPNARRASCLSNMKQLGLALTEYAQDSNESLPSYATASGRNWRTALYPYVRSGIVYQCPDDKRDRSSDSPENLPKSYAANYLSPSRKGQTGGAFAAAGEMPGTLAMFDHPDKVIALTDTRGSDRPEWSMTEPVFLPGTGRELYAHAPKHAFYEHPGGSINCLFTDGHVKSMKPMDTLTPTNFWTRDNAPFVGADLANAQAILKHVESE